MRMFEVGGCVRDEIMGRKSNDIDFSVVLSDSERAGIEAVNGDSFRFMVNTLAAMGFKIFQENPEHLTVRAQFPKPNGRNVSFLPTGLTMAKSLPTADFVLARKEGAYSDGRRPDVVEPGTLEDDLARRDFTMNAIAKHYDSEFGVLHVDPFNGREDINRKLIRAVGDPHERLTEDALRALRAVRFSVTLGFEIEPELMKAIEYFDVLDSIVNNIADDRIREELDKMFKYDTIKSLFVLNKFPLLTLAVFAGKVSLLPTMKQKGLNK